MTSSPIFTTGLLELELPPLTAAAHKLLLLLVVVPQPQVFLGPVSRDSSVAAVGRVAGRPRDRRRARVRKFFCFAVGARAGPSGGVQQFPQPATPMPELRVLFLQSP